MKKRKILALFTSLALTLSSAVAVVPVMAEEAASTSGEKTFKEYLHQELDKKLEESEPAYQAYVKSLQDSVNGVETEMSLTVEDAGKSMLAMMVPMDLSWLNSVGTSMKVSMPDGVENIEGDISLNGNSVLNYLLKMDMKTMDMYMAAPQILNGILTSNYIESYKLVEQNGGMDAATMGMTVTPEQMQAIMAALVSFTSNPPEYATLKNIAKRYSDIVIDAYEDAGKSTIEDRTIASITKPVEIVEGRLTPAGSLEMVKNLFTTAKDDPDLKGIIEPVSPDTYAMFQSSISELLTELSGASVDENDKSAVVTDIFLDKEGKSIGAAVGFDAGDGNAAALFYAMDLVQEDAFETYAEAGSGASGVAAFGSGTVKDGKRNGIYTLYNSDSAAIAAAEITDFSYDADSSTADGTVKFYVPAEQAADDPNVSFLASFDAVVDFHYTMDGGSYSVTLNSGGAPLARLVVTAHAGAGPQLLDTAGTAVYDMNNQDDMMKAMQGLNLGVLIDNLTKAGVPEEFLQMFFPPQT